MNTYHTSVLLNETIDLLNVEPGKRYIDGTLGGGGHTFEILDRGGIVLSLDFDNDALAYVSEKVKSQNSKVKIGENLFLARGNFKNIDKLAKENGIEAVDGVLFDLGVSSHHFDTPERGFSVQKEGPLDMRMDQDLGVKAADLLNILTKGELYELFTKFGEERFAYAISNSIVRSRQVKRIETTTDLVGIINRVVPKGRENINPATRVFQALRIAVNDELNNLTEALPKALALLKSNGRVAVISFHSLEDRIVKNTFKEWEEKELGTIITKKPIVPTESEIQMNTRSRSSKLRVFQKM